MIILFVPFFYMMAFIVWVLILGAMLVIYFAVIVIVFVLTALAMLVGSAWRPRRPKSPISQARFSDRR